MVGSSRLGEWFTPCQSKDPSPTIPTFRQKEEKGKNTRRKKMIEQLRPIKKALALFLDPASPTSNTVSARSYHRDTARKIKVLLYCEVLHKYTLHEYTMSDQSTACNLHCYIRPRLNTMDSAMVLSGYTRSYTAFKVLPQIDHRRWVMTRSNTPSVRKRAPLTKRSSSLRCVSATEHHTAEQCYKTGKTKPWKHLPRSDLSWNTRQDFLKIPSLWEAALETERRFVSKVILESNDSPNISRSSDSFKTVRAIVNGGDWGCILRDLMTIIFLVLLSFNFIVKKVTPLTNPAMVTYQGLCYCNSDAWGWHTSHQSGIIGIADQFILQNVKRLL